MPASNQFRCVSDSCVSAVLPWKWTFSRTCLLLTGTIFSRLRRTYSSVSWMLLTAQEPGWHSHRRPYTSLRIRQTNYRHRFAVIANQTALTRSISSQALLDDLIRGGRITVSALHGSASVA